MRALGIVALVLAGVAVAIVAQFKLVQRDLERAARACPCAACEVSEWIGDAG